MQRIRIPMGATTRKQSSKPQSKSAALPAIPSDGFLSRKQAAAFAGVNVQIVDAAIRRGELRAYKVKGRDVKGRPTHGRRVVIAKQDVIAWVTANQV